MSYKGILKYTLKLLLVDYFCAVIGYTIDFATSPVKDSFLELFSPVILFNEIISFNLPVIWAVVIGTYVFVRWNYLYNKKVDLINWFQRYW